MTPLQSSIDEINFHLTSSNQASRPGSTVSFMSSDSINCTSEASIVDSTATYASVVSKVPCAVESETTDLNDADATDTVEEVAKAVREGEDGKSCPSTSCSPEEGANGTENIDQTTDGMFNGHLKEECSLRRTWREDASSHQNEELTSEVSNGCPTVDLDYSAQERSASYSIAPSETARYMLVSPPVRNTIIHHMSNRPNSEARAIRGSQSRYVSRPAPLHRRQVINNNGGPIYPFPNNGESGSSFIIPSPIERTHEFMSRQQQVNLNAHMYDQQGPTFMNNHATFPTHRHPLFYPRNTNYYSAPQMYRSQPFFPTQNAFYRPVPMAAVYHPPPFSPPLTPQLPLTTDQFAYFGSYQPMQALQFDEEDFEEKQRVQSCVIAALRMANSPRSTDLGQSFG